MRTGAAVDGESCTFDARVAGRPDTRRRMLALVALAGLAGALGVAVFSLIGNVPRLLAAGILLAAFAIGGRPVTDALVGLVAFVLLAVVTAFTVAHSITLSLAALAVISLPSRLVESTIALSVVLAALNNLKPVVAERRRACRRACSAKACGASCTQRCPAAEWVCS